MSGRFGGPRGNEFHAGFGLHWLFPLLFLGLLTAAVVVAILALMRTRHPAIAGPPPAAPRPPDQALYELRLRYARGELSRDEYLQRAADLGDLRPPTPPMTPPSPPAPGPAQTAPPAAAPAPAPAPPVVQELPTDPGPPAPPT